MIRPFIVLSLCLACTPAFSQGSEGSGASGNAGGPSEGAFVEGVVGPPAGETDLAQAVAEGSGEAAAPNVAVRVEFPGGTEARVGQPVPVEVSVTLPAGVALAGVNVAGNRYIEVVSDDDVLDRGDGVSRRSMRLAVFRSGEFDAEGMEAVVIDGEGRQFRIASDPFTLNVSSVIVNETNPERAPSDPPLRVMTRDMRPVYAGAALGCVLFGFLVALVWRKLRNDEADDPVAFVPGRPAWEVAFEALDALEAADLLSAGEHLEFHMRVSEILRTYIGARFGFFAPEMTTTEISSWLRRHDSDAGGYREEIIEVLGEMDVVKFARYVPPRDMSEHCVAEARRLVSELSARDREQAAGEVQAGVGPSAQPMAAAAERAHAPSPVSTTHSFEGASRPAEEADDGEAPTNIIQLPPREAQKPSSPTRPQVGPEDEA